MTDPRITTIRLLLSWTGNGEHTPEDYDQALRDLDSLAALLAEKDAENERLRKESADWLSMVDEGHVALATQVQTLTEALTRIASCDCQIACERLSGYTRCASCVARDALAAAQKPPAEGSWQPYGVTATGPCGQTPFVPLPVQEPPAEEPPAEGDKD